MNPLVQGLSLNKPTISASAPATSNAQAAGTTGKAPGLISSLLGSAGGYFNRLTGGGSNPFSTSGSLAGNANNSIMTTLGKRAASPTQNISTAAPTLPSKMAAPPAQQPTPAPQQQPPAQQQAGTNQTASVGNTTTNPNSLVGLLAGTSALGSPSAPGYIGATAATGLGNIPIAAQATDIANQFGQQYADVGQQGARFRAGQLTTGTSPVAEGNAAVTAQTTAQQQQALAEGEQSALQGLGYQLQGQQQASGALNQAAGQSLTAQQLQQQGLGAASGLIPSPLLYGAFGGGNLSPGGYLPSLAAQVKNGLISPQDAESISSSIYGGSGGAMLNQALQGGDQTQSNGFNYVQGQANANAEGANLQQTQTQAQQTQQAVSYASQLLDDLTSSYSNLSGFQKSGLPPLNALGNIVAGTGLAGQGALSATTGYSQSVQEARAAITQALSSSGQIGVQQAGNVANSLLPDNATPQQIATAKSYLQSFMSQRQSVYTQPPAAAQYGGGGAPSTSSGIYNY